MNRGLLMRKLFAVAKERGLNVEDLRLMADENGWGHSISKLDDKQLRLLVDNIEKKKAEGLPFLEFRLQPAPERRKLMGKLSKLLWSRGYGWNYADSIAKRMHGCDMVDWLGPDKLHDVVAAVAKQASRKAPSRQ